MMDEPEWTEDDEAAANGQLDEYMDADGKIDWESAQWDRDCNRERAE
jgi:hypothetical protein